MKVQGTASLKQLRSRYLKLVPRERALVIFAAIAIVGAIGDLAVVGPQLTKKANLIKRIESQDTESLALRTALATAPPDPNTALRSQQKALQAQLAATDEEYARIQGTLVQPDQMGPLVQSLLAHHRGLELVSLRNLPVVRLTEERREDKQILTTADAAAVVKAAASGASAAPSTAKTEDVGLWRHAVEIRVHGSYDDLTAYLNEIEGLPKHIHWGSLQLEARDYPENLMIVTIYTVSLEKSWWVL